MSLRLSISLVVAAALAALAALPAGAAPAIRRHCGTVRNGVHLKEGPIVQIKHTISVDRCWRFGHRLHARHVTVSEGTITTGGHATGYTSTHPSGPTVTGYGPGHHSFNVYQAWTDTYAGVHDQTHCVHMIVWDRPHHGHYSRVSRRCASG
ncbi:MAG TPA: hypothetical protein VGI54_04355 [Solirubrobacteraceae bacterium]